MDVPIMIGQHLFTGFDGTVMAEDFCRKLRESKIGNIILFARNIGTAAQVRALCLEIQRLVLDATGQPALIAIDQEGGVVSRLGADCAVIPSAMAVSATGDPELAYRAGLLTGSELAAMGINFNLAPVLDINSNPDNPEVNIRSFGDNAAAVSRYGAAAMQGLMDGGLVPTAKHFPGRGEDASDAHYDLPVTTKTREEMFRTNLAPYQRLVRLGLPSMMLAHQVVPAFDAARAPATLSKPIIEGVIRKELGFGGVITTDSITMAGLMKICPMEEAPARALQAGCDLLLFKSESPSEIEMVMKRAAAMVRSGEIPLARVEASVERVLAMKERIGLFRTKGWNDPARLERLLALAKYRRLAERAARTATLLLRDRRRSLPVKAGARVLVVEQALFQSRACNDKHFHSYMLWEQVRRFAPGAGLFRVGLLGGDAELEQLAKVAGGYDVVIATSYYSRGAKPNGGFLVKLQQMAKRMVVVSMTPYRLSAPDELDCVLCNFSEYPPSLQAATEIIYGVRKAGKRWPVSNGR